MADEVRLAIAFAIAMTVTWIVVPVAIRVARRTQSYDHPVGYKGHDHPTPYLGGAAVMAGFVPGAALLGGGLDRFAPIVACALALLIVGTIDDRRTLSPIVRIIATAIAGATLFHADLGLSAFDSGAADLALTVALVLGVVNAYNLIDNIDGAAATIGAVSAAGLGVLCAAQGAPLLAALSLALAGACAGFLPRNLSRPARIFLGDGGSMPVGFVLAVTIMNVPDTHSLGWAMLLVAAVLVGIPALDTTLVVVSRLRRGVAVYKGGRDHLTHRLLARLGSPRHVVLVAAVVQAALTVLGGALSQSPRDIAAIGASAILVAGLILIASLEWPRRVLAEQTRPAS